MAATPHRLRGRALHALPIVIGALALAGCGGSDDSGGGGDSTTPANDSVAAQEAVDSYRHYLIEQTGILVDRTRAFVKALNYGNVEQAKSLYANTRMPYEAV